MRVLWKTDFVRFSIVVVVGLCIDISISWTLANFGGIPLPLAAVGGFLAGATTNYLLHEFWTFRVENAQLSARRGLFYLTVTSVTLGARIAGVATLEQILPFAETRKLEVLILATGFSFIVNYVLTKYLVFRARHKLFARQSSK